MKCLIVNGGVLRIAKPSEMSDGDTITINGKTYTARMDVKTFNEFQMSSDPNVVLQSLKDALSRNSVYATIEERKVMEWFVFYDSTRESCYEFESFPTELEALEYINTTMKEYGAELEDFRLVYGDEKRLKAVSVITQVAVDA